MRFRASATPAAWQVLSTPGSVTLLSSDLFPIHINADETYAIKVTVQPAGTPIVWTSSDPSIATVENGVVTGLKDGRVVIMAEASLGNDSAAWKFSVTVNGPVYRFLLVGESIYEMGFQDEFNDFWQHLLTHTHSADWKDANNPCPANTANAFARALRKSPMTSSDYIRVSNNLAHDDLQRELHQIFSMADDNDVTVFYFAGHGHKKSNASLPLTISISRSRNCTTKSA